MNILEPVGQVRDMPGCLRDFGAPKLEAEEGLLYDGGDLGNGPAFAGVMKCWSCE